MRIRMFRIVLVCGLLTVFAASQALAWGPKAQSAIANTALKMLRAQMPEAFKGEDANYEKDMLAGAEEGYQAMGGALPAKDSDQAVASIAMEINLLREVRKYRTGSYFSYRMGILAALTADVLVPYGISQAREEYLKEQIEANIDEHMKSFSFQPHDEGKLQDIRTPIAYFAEQRKFFSDARRIIAADYAGGKGYNGYLQTGAQAYFKGAIEGVADVWYTILAGTGGMAPSDRALVDYFVREVDYLLTVKRNPHEAEKAYACFADVNKGDLGAYGRVGDIFYDYGLTERGVQEWKTALSLTGPERQAILEKLATHYLKSGRQLFESASSPEPPENALEDALKAFQLAIEYDPESAEAGERLSATRLAIQEKQERLELVVNIMAAAERVVNEAQQNETNELYAQAIDQYKQAKLLYGSITEEFPTQRKAATDGALQVTNQISRIISKRLDAADALIDQGDACIEREEFDAALEKYNLVPTTLKVVPDDPATKFGQQKKQLLEGLNNKVALVDVRKKEAADRKAAEEKRRQQQRDYEEHQRRTAQQKKPPAAEKPEE